MPLHKVPLCSFAYVGEPASGSGTLKYDVRHLMIRDNNTKLFEEVQSDLVKDNSTNLKYKKPTTISKHINKDLYSKLIGINKSDTPKEFYTYTKDFQKCSDISLNRLQLNTIDINRLKVSLEFTHDKHILKSRDLPLDLPHSFIDKNIILELIINNERAIDIGDNISLGSYKKTEIFISQSKNMGTSHKQDISIDISQDLERVDKLSLVKEDCDKLLLRDDKLKFNKDYLLSFYNNRTTGIVINTNRFLNTLDVQEFNMQSNVSLGSYYDKIMSIEYRFKSMHREECAHINKAKLLNMYNSRLGNIVIENDLLLEKSIISKLDYNLNCLLSSNSKSGLNKYKESKYINPNRSKGIDIDNAKEVYNTKINQVNVDDNSKLLDRDTEVIIDKSFSRSFAQGTLFNIVKIPITQYVLKGEQLPIIKSESISLVKDNIIPILRDKNPLSLIINKITNISFESLKSLNDISIIPIQKDNRSNYLQKLKGIKSISKSGTNSLSKLNNIKSITKESNSKLLYISRINEIVNDKLIKNVVSYKDKLINIVNQNKYLRKKENSQIFKVDNFKLLGLDFNSLAKSLPNKMVYKSSKLIFKIDSKYMNKDNIKPVFKLDSPLFMYKTWQSLFNPQHLKEVAKSYDIIFRSNIVQGINKLVKETINIPIIKGLSDSYLRLSKNKTFSMSKCENPIYHIKGRFMHRARMPIYLPPQRPLHRLRMNINYKTIPHPLEVTKRWWVLDATGPYDYKILPYDYRYQKNPLWIHRRDREYGTRYQELKAHPISYMPYLEDNKGADLHYGTREIALSIEIMLDMANILVMIFKHSANQFANCSGQETMEFIMELLFDWLTLDSTIEEMDNKGSREHYLRVYRWFRWEAEKVWFMADNDHSQDCMHGIKFAGILVKNILEYMKNHHFNIVPLWRNITFMDIERQFNRNATNGDLMVDLDKLKSKRHYFIEEKNIRRK